MQDNPEKDIIENASLVEDEVEMAVQDVEADLLTAQSKIEELNDAWLRARADVENLRRRAQEDVNNAHKYSIGKFATDLLGVKDSLEMAMSDESGQFDSLKKGVDLTLKQLNGVFEHFQLKEINPIGEKLDPHKHQAMGMQPSDVEANTVLTVLQKGYQLYDRVLRPAMVIVSNGQSKNE